MIASSARITAQTRFRLTYRISVGYISGADGLRAAINRINEYLSERPPYTFMVARASAPQSGGGVLRSDYFISVDLLTEYVVPSATWGEVLANVQRIPLGFAGIDARADLHDSVIVSRTSPVAVSPLQQQETAAGAARIARENQPLTVLAGSLTQIGTVLVLVAIGLVVWKYKK